MNDHKLRLGLEFRRFSSSTTISSQTLSFSESSHGASVSDTKFAKAGSPPRLLYLMNEPRKTSCSGIKIIPGTSRLLSILPSQLRRYDARCTMSTECDKWQIGRMLSVTNFEREERPGWKSYIHPEGMLYHRTSRDGLTFSTDVDIYEDGAFEQVQDAVGEISHRFAVIEDRDNEAKPRSRYEIVLDIAPDNNVEYYIVDHTTHHVLWLDSKAIESMCCEVSNSAPHLRNLLLYEYYTHLSLYPHQNVLLGGEIDELKGILTWLLADTMTSAVSLSCYDSDELARLITLTETMKSIKDSAPEFAVASVARIRSRFEFDRFIFFYGHTHARLNADKSIFKNNPKLNSIAVALLSVLFCNGLRERLNMLNELFVDHLIQLIAFKRTTEKLIKRWQVEIICDGVLLLLDFSYLATSGLLAEPQNRTVGGIASFVSAVSCMSSAVIGLVLMRRLQNMDENNTPANTLAKYHAHWWSQRYGMLKLAMMYSLPYALLVYGTISFIVAIVHAALFPIRANAQCILMGVVLLLAFMACMWAVCQPRVRSDDGGKRRVCADAAERNAEEKV